MDHRRPKKKCVHEMLLTGSLTNIFRRDFTWLVVPHARRQHRQAVFATISVVRLSSRPVLVHEWQSIGPGVSSLRKTSKNQQNFRRTNIHSSKCHQSVRADTILGWAMLSGLWQSERDAWWAPDWSEASNLYSSFTIKSWTRLWYFWGVFLPRKIWSENKLTAYEF